MRHSHGLLLVSVLFGLVVASPARAGIMSFFHLADAASFHYELTVTLRAGGQLYSGSAVQGLFAETEIKTLPGIGGGLLSDIFGQAVAVEIPGRPSIFFLIAGGRASAGWSWKIIRDCGLQSSDPDPVRRLDKFRAFIGPCTLGPKSSPFAVRFGDEARMDTIEAVRFPDGDLELVSVTVRRTDAPLSQGIEQRLPWLPRDPAHGLIVPIAPDLRASSTAFEHLDRRGALEQ